MTAQRKPKLTRVRKDHDAAWKDAFRLFLPQFLQMFHPEMASATDHSRPIRFLEQELRRIQRRAKIGRRAVDILAELPLRGGGEMWLLVHIEVQSRKDPELPHRMWVYHYRAYDLYRHPVVSMVVLADKTLGWKPSIYESIHFGCNLTLEYPVFKLLDLAPRLEELETSSNPFALVVASHLRVQQTSSSSELLLDKKLALCRRLIRLGLTRDEVDGLFVVIDAIMTLDPVLEEKFERTTYNLEDPMELELFKSNRFIDKGIEKGREEGLEKGRAEVVQRMLARGLDRELILDVSGLSEEALAALEKEHQGQH